MMRRLIIFMVRTRMGLKKYEKFTFSNQKSNAVYYFNESNLMKYWHGQTVLSGVSINWLLDPECEITKVDAK